MRESLDLKWGELRAVNFASGNETLRQVKAEADRLRLRTKQRFAADGTRTGGLPFRRGHLHCLLTNPLYAGRIRHQRRVYEGVPSIYSSGRPKLD